MNTNQHPNYRMRDDPILRSCAFIAIIYLGSLFLFGIWVYIIVLGLSIFARTILIRVPYFLNLTRKYFGFKHPEEIARKPQSKISKIATTALSVLVMSIYLAMSLALIRLGITRLLDDGFLNQNLVYIFFFR